MSRKNKTRKPDKPRGDAFDNYVEHPRYGRRPHITGLDPQQRLSGGDDYIYLHWHSPAACRIPNTAIVADRSRQPPATLPVTHYFDVKRECRICHRPFIFFAQEQKHWYESLKFPLEADCRECPPCRKRQQGIARERERYNELFHLEKRRAEENVDMAECCLSLIEKEAFSRKQLPTVRRLLKAVKEPGAKLKKRIDAIHARLEALKGSTELTREKPE
jgi:hypothetical protein